MYTISQAIRDIAATGIPQTYFQYFDGISATRRWVSPKETQETGAEICAVCVMGAIVMAVADDTYVHRLIMSATGGIQEVERNAPHIYRALVSESPLPVKFWPLQKGWQNYTPSLNECLVHMNDTLHMTFEQIANVIEKYENLGLISYKPV